MKILFLSQVLSYPLDAGPKWRSYYVLRYLAEKHQITLVTFVRQQDSPAAIAHLESFCHQVHPVLLTRSRVRDAMDLASALVQNKSFLIQRDDLGMMHARISEIVAQETFDAVHADQLSMAHYALPLKMRRVLDEHNAVWKITERMGENETNGLKRTLLTNEAAKLRAHEARMMTQFDRIITVTPQDAQALTFADAPPRAPFKTIPICIDPATLPFKERTASARNIIFMGGLLYPPNVDGVLWFARHALPQIWAKFPDAKFFIVGARPPNSITALGEQDSRIQVTGYVQDPAVYLDQSAVFVVPLRAGGGMRVKILDAWARGIPMVTTTIGSEGIETISNENILTADTPEAFAGAVIKLLQDDAFARSVAVRGRAWVEQNYDWKKIYTAFDEIYPPA
ncbi:MAG: glycosyltransferase [Chloroflexota bacterium]|nr:MAG: glycosyltransferase [Chloroflexota bacterium]